MLIAPAGASASVSHVVAAGESLSSIAASDGLSVEQLAGANGLSPEALLLEGSTLTIPSQETETPQSAPSAGESASTAEAAAPSAGSYVVQPGDTLWAIARHLDPNGDVRPLVDTLSREVHGRPLQVGQRLVVP